MGSIDRSQKKLDAFASQSGGPDLNNPIYTKRANHAIAER
jgi:hypothetical protein